MQKEKKCECIPHFAFRIRHNDMLTLIQKSRWAGGEGRANPDKLKCTLRCFHVFI